MFQTFHKETEDFENKFLLIEPDSKIDNLKSQKIINCDNFKPGFSENDSTFDSRKSVKNNCENFKPNFGQNFIEESIDSSSIASDPEEDEVNFCF